MKLFSIKLLYVLVLSVSILSFSAKGTRPLPGSEKKSPVARTRILIAPSINFYKINKNHSGSAKQKMSALFCIKEEFRLNENHTMYFSIGAEYFVHGLNFYSYYFTPDSIQLYNGEMNYQYHLYLHEIDIPLQLKISFKRENNALTVPYIMFGYHLRTLMFGTLKVKEDGNTIINKREEITFKNPLLGKKNNSFASLTLGLQRNKPNNTRRCVFAEVSYRVGFSPYLLQDEFTPSSLFITESNLTMGIGVKF